MALSASTIDKIKNSLRKRPLVAYPLKLAYRRMRRKVTAEDYHCRSLYEIDHFEPAAKPKLLDRPEGSLIEITNACNLKCRMCNTHLQERTMGLMEPELFERIVLELKSVGIHMAALHTVGETFVYKKIETLLEICERHNFQPTISTNGMFPARIREVYERFPNTAFAFRLSSDGATKETFEYIRTGGSFELMTETLGVIGEINEGKINYRLTLGIDSILCMSNIHELPEHFRLYGKYAWAESMNFCLVNGLTPDDRFFRQTFPFPNLIRPTPPCSMPFRNMYFTYDGKATMCCRDYEAEIIAGDINTHSIEEIWNGPGAEAIRRQHLDPSTLEINACLNCYKPHDAASNVANNFVHYLYARHADMDSKLFGETVLALLEGMDTALGKNDVSGLRNFVDRLFRDNA